MKSKSKTVLSLVASFTVLLSMTAAHGADPLYQWSFNSSDGSNAGTGTGGILAANGGVGATTGSFGGGGITGNAGDYSLGASNTNYGGAGIGNAATGSNVNLDGLSQFTITMWIKRTAGSWGSSASLLSIGATTSPDGTSNPGISLGVSPLWQNGVTFGVNGKGPEWTGNLGIADNNWIFVAFVYNGNNGAQWGQEDMIALYGGDNRNSRVITGSANTSASVAAAPMIHDGSYWNSPGVPSVGATATAFLANNGANTTGFTGNLDDVRIYNGLLTLPEIDAVRLSAFAEPLPPTDLYWKGDVDNSWASLNWTSDMAGAVPGGALATDGSDGVTFATTGAANLSNVLGANQNVRSIVVTTNLAPIVIGGTHSLTLGEDGLWVELASGGLSINTTGGVILDSNQTWKNKSPNPLTVDSVLSGIGTLTKSGTGQLRLGGDNLHSGGTVVEQGTLALDHANALGGATASLAMNGGTLDLNGKHVTLGELSGINGSIIQNSSASASSLTLDVSSDITYTCSINAGPGVGPVSLVKKGLAKVTSNGGCNFTGPVSIEDGQFVANYPNYGGPPTNSSLGNLQVADRTITVTYPGELRLTNNNIFGNQNANPSLLPEIIVNETSVSATNYNLIGDITLNAATLSQSAFVFGNYHGYQFKGVVKVTGATGASSISGSVGNHLSANTLFDVEDVTGGDDLFVTTPLIDQSGDFGSAPGGFTKAGAGSMYLSGASTYTGNTIVSEGTLILAAPSLSDTGTLEVAADATIYLDFPPENDTDIVESLILGGASKPLGTYGPVGSGVGVEFESSLITGTGFIQVVGPADPFADWAEANGATGQTMDQDHDNDGVDNGIEYFMGETLSTFTANPAAASGAVTWPMDDGYTGDYGIDYEVQSSTDLVTWTQVLEGTGDNTVTVTAGTSVVYNLPTGGTSFVRLVVRN